MGLTNCSQCGTLFQTYGAGRRCPGCLETEDDDFRKVAEYLREAGDRTIGGIAAATGVDRRLILRWLRQKRLQTKLVPGELSCRRCGTPVPGGSFCDACRLALADEVSVQRRLAGQVNTESAGAPGARARERPSEQTPGSKAKRRGMYYRSFTTPPSE